MTSSSSLDENHTYLTASSLPLLEAFLRTSPVPPERSPASVFSSGNRCRDRLCRSAGIAGYSFQNVSVNRVISTALTPSAVVTW